ncbi:hypothetical protein K438DRAFT_1838539 [Mycena galopus ATCC 62051]|nr:hypothetical protein K438DRAFT_1838539 [Mycena galopus ATCC 62051]
MPITFTLTHECTATDILAKALQFGFCSDTDMGGYDSQDFPDSQGNGFVNTVLAAYNEHRALVIRPDDVWLTIISQFNFFVNANAELLRANFGTRYDVDFGAMSRQMVSLIEKNVVDPTLREWAMPGFTTTTVNDTTVAAVLMMATLKAYFAYGMCCSTCGIPRVTLEGEKSDWVNILGRLEKLKEYGIETIAWYHLLHPVISAFINAFDAPESEENVDFWQRVARYLYPNMSGGSPYSGWINAFTVFSKEGAWVGYPLDKTLVPQVPPEDLTTEQFWATYSNLDAQSLRQAPYHSIRHENIPPAYAEVDVKLVDNGQKFDCLMLAGVTGTRVSSSGDLGLSSTGKDDTVQPASCWWMCTKKENVVSTQEEYEAEMEELERNWEAFEQQLKASGAK